ncbi:MAG: hypothetical protein JSS83_26455 [Cyanobacteria bacterium SZAS LIN-3]|nr:hypothetical protein [Cyanobacteria bacterium SZAS LIN-3]
MDPAQLEKMIDVEIAQRAEVIRVERKLIAEKYALAQEEEFRKIIEEKYPGSIFPPPVPGFYRRWLLLEKSVRHAVDFIRRHVKPTTVDTFNRCRSRQQDLVDLSSACHSILLDSQSMEFRLKEQIANTRKAIHILLGLGDRSALICKKRRRLRELEVELKACVLLQEQRRAIVENRLFSVNDRLVKVFGETTSISRILSHGVEGRAESKVLKSLNVLEQIEGGIIEREKIATAIQLPPEKFLALNESLYGELRNKVDLSEAAARESCERVLSMPAVDIASLTETELNAALLNFETARDTLSEHCGFVVWFQGQQEAVLASMEEDVESWKSLAVAAQAAGDEAESAPYLKRCEELERTITERKAALVSFCEQFASVKELYLRLDKAIWKVKSRLEEISSS